MPTADKDCASKGYIDQQINDTHIKLSRIDKCIKGSMLTIKFGLSRMAPSTVHRLGDRLEQSFFVLARFKTRNNLWDARDQPKVEITVKGQFLTHSEERFISLQES